MQIEWPSSDNYEYYFTISPLKSLPSAIHTANMGTTIVVNNYSLWKEGSGKNWAWVMQLLSLELHFYVSFWYGNCLKCNQSSF